MHATASQLKKLHRLKKRAEFLNAQNHKKYWVAKGLTLQIAPNTSGAMRVGFTVSRKASRSSVERNRIKRRLRAAAADILPGCAAEGYDYVLIGKPAGLDRPYTALCGDLKWCIQKLGVLKGTEGGRDGETQTT